MCGLQRNYDVIRNWERFETGPLTVDINLKIRKATRTSEEATTTLVLASYVTAILYVRADMTKVTFHFVYLLFNYLTYSHDQVCYKSFRKSFFSFLMKLFNIHFSCQTMWVTNDNDF